MRDPETAPFQYLHAGSTDHENYEFDAAPIPESADHATNDEALERMLTRYIRPALDFLDAFLAGRADPAAVPRVRWHLAGAGWQESPSWPPPGASELRLYPAGDALATEPGERSRDDLGARSGESRALDARQPVRGPARVSGRARDRLSARRPDVHDPRAGRAPDAGRPRRRPPRGGERGPVDAPPRQARRRPRGRPRPRAPVRPAGRRERRPRRARSRSTSATRATACSRGTGCACRWPRATFPCSCRIPARAENPWDATATRTNLQTLATGGETPSYLSLTVLRGER